MWIVHAGLPEGPVRNATDEELVYYALGSVCGRFQIWIERESTKDDVKGELNNERTQD